MKGFSVQNLWRIRAFYIAWMGKASILSQLARELPEPLAEIPWFHNVILLMKLKDPQIRLWYAHKTAEHGWSRAVLTHQIESGLHLRQGKALTNFKRTLPSPQSELAQEMIKNDYNLDLTIPEGAKERDIELALVENIRRSMLELGTGFAFVGNQHHLEVGGEDFYIDLLFYHLQLRCYVVIELKTDAFKPEHAGKLGFYLAAVDDLLRHPDDQPSIGLILCKSNNKIIAEYALRNMNKPIGVASYRLTKTLPAALAGRLPTTKELEKKLLGKD